MSRFVGWGIFLGFALVVMPAGAQSLGGPTAATSLGGWGIPAGGETRFQGLVRSSQSVPVTGRPVAGPARYAVRPGDTLWGICETYLGNPWLWPEVWSLNPEITNPHWIYPGQVLRLRREVAPDAMVQPPPPSIVAWRPGDVIYFRNEGFIDENAPEEDLDEDEIPEEQRPPGRIVASWEDHMLLTDPQLLYVRFDDDFPVQAGQQYTIYRIRETVYDIVEEDSDEDPRRLGRIVEILGTGVVLSYDTDVHLARMQLIEALNPIERNDLVGPIQRNLIVSEPRPAEVDLDGRIVAALRPFISHTPGFVVFVNRGYEDGVRDGNRFQIIRATDHYLESRGEDIPVDLPFEWIGECQVLEARRTSSTCLVVTVTREIFVGERVALSRG